MRNRVLLAIFMLIVSLLLVWVVRMSGGGWAS
jgi:hypothetical protein